VWIPLEAPKKPLQESLAPCLGAQEGFEQRCRARGIATFVLDPHDAILLACDTLPTFGGAPAGREQVRWF
jgi:hypothetical protein